MKSKTTDNLLLVPITWRVVKEALKTWSLVGLSVLSLFLVACSTTQTDEPKYTDFYEVKQYEVKTETYTNEIITTVFIQKFVETNKVSVITNEIATDFGGYEFEPLMEVEEPVIKQNLTTPEFQCVDGSCEVKEK